MKHNRITRWTTAAAAAAPLVLALAVLDATPASASLVATFTPGAKLLTVFGDAGDNAITVGRNAAGAIVINGGAVLVAGGSPTVVNVELIQVFGQAGADRVALDEAQGALPRANLFGGAGDDSLTGGSGADQLFGQAGRDTVLGRRGTDIVFGGDDNDTLIAGDGDDQVFGEAGDDLLVWQPSDDTDLDEGGAGRDTVRVDGDSSSETFTLVANGVRARFERTAPRSFSIDIGTTERFELDAAAGSDRFQAGAGLGALALNVTGGDGDDRLIASDTIDVLLGGNGDDRVEAGAGADLVLPGPGDDLAIAGAGDDTVNGDAGDDVLVGGNGDDRIIGGPGFDVVAGGADRDVITEAEDVADAR